MEHGFKLASGTTMPAVGFGTWALTPDTAAEEAVSAALKIGFRHIDTARLYANERGVGRAVKAAGVPREDIFVTTKLWNDDQAYDKALKAFDASLDRLGLDYVDLYLIHWPQKEASSEAWRALQSLYDSGRAKAIGVSNFSISQIEQLSRQGGVTPMVNQIEFHPELYGPQKKLVEYCHAHGIVVEAYRPLANYTGTSTKAIDDIAGRHGKTASQVILRWCLQHDTAPLPRSANPDHMQEDLDIFDFTLTDDEMQALDALGDTERKTAVE